MKQVDKVIRKGDYYEMQVLDDGLFSMKPYKKQQSQIHIQANADNLVTDLPTYKEARSNYYYELQKPDELIFELEQILNNQKLSDEDKQEINKIIRQIQILKEEPLVPLSELTPSKKPVKVALKLNEVELKIRVDLSELQRKVDELQKFSYPELNAYEHQLEVLLGEKKIASHAQIPKQDRNKEDIEHLFALCNSLSCAGNISGLVDKIHSNNAKYEQMASWAHQLQTTTTFHTDFLAELKDDELLLDKLQQNFNKNVAQVKETIAKLKQESKK